MTKHAHAQTNCTYVPLAPHHQPIQELTIHGFEDASGNGVCAVVYAVVKQEDGVTQGLVCSKSRLQNEI